jgi:hypothetical protein
MYRIAISFHEADVSLLPAARSQGAKPTSKATSREITMAGGRTFHPDLFVETSIRKTS